LLSLTLILLNSIFRFIALESEFKLSFISFVRILTNQVQLVFAWLIGILLYIFKFDYRAIKFNFDTFAIFFKFAFLVIDFSLSLGIFFTIAFCSIILVFAFLISIFVKESKWFEYQTTDCWVIFFILSFLIISE
jgi:hypothetical protein